MYWRSIFISDITKNGDKAYHAASSWQTITDEMLERGYVTKDDVMDMFEPDEIVFTLNSYVIEFDVGEWPPKEVRRLRVV